MAADLGCTWPQTCQDCKQPIDADQLRPGSPVIILSVEPTAIADGWRHAAHRNAVMTGQVGHDQSRGFIAMDVLMRVDVGGRPSDKALKAFKLPDDLF